MSKILRVVWLFICAVALCLPLALPSGCASASKNAYVTSGATHVTARAALRGWDEYLRQQYASVTNLATTAPDKAAKRKAELLQQEATVKDAYQKYQASQLAVITAAREFSRIPPANTNSPSSEDRLTAAVTAAGVTLTSLLDVLQQFGVTVK